MTVAVAAVVVLALAASVTVWQWSQDEPVAGWLWWLCAASAAVPVAASAVLRRLGLRVAAGTGARTVVCLLLVLVAVFLVAQIASTVRERLSDPRSTRARVTGCHVTGRGPVEDGGLPSGKTYACTFHWSADGREFSAERPEGPYPEGHEVTVWLDDRGRMSTGRPSWVTVPLFGLCVPFVLAGAVHLGRGAAEGVTLWRRRAARRDR